MDSSNIRIGDSTKHELEKIREEEDHSSLDSVIKTLLIVYQFYQDDLDDIDTN